MEPIGIPVYIDQRLQSLRKERAELLERVQRVSGAIAEMERLQGVIVTVPVETTGEA